MSTDTKVAHTPAPWRVSTRNCDSGAGTIAYVNSEKPAREICVLYYDEDQDANARLIAAAPDLLALLKEYREEIDDHQGCSEYDSASVGDNMDVEHIDNRCDLCKRADDLIAKVEASR